jgi:hypothetical protein
LYHQNPSHELIEGHGVISTLTSLEIIVQERARLLISLVHLKALKKHLLVLDTSSLELLLLHGLVIILLGWGLFAASTGHGTGNSTYGTVCNGRSSTKGHTLGNG